jgi:cell division protein FtsN
VHAVPSVRSPLFDPPVDNIQIIPGLPNPNSNRIYRLQVGAFSGVESATRAVRQLQVAGFDVVQELAENNLYRVLAVGIPAHNVYNAAQRLGAIGFKQVWVRD